VRRGLYGWGIVDAINSGDPPEAVAGLIRDAIGSRERKTYPGLVGRRAREAAKYLCLPSTPSVPGPCDRPNHGGGIDLLLEGEFFGSQWASGEVSATSSDGSQPEVASVGYDYVSAGNFGPRPCGTTTTLKATPTRGNHFDRWKSSEGLCQTAATTCTVPITTTAHQLTAYFAPTVYRLSVTNDQPDGIVSSGGAGGYVDPGIDCGSIPNGPTTQVFTNCSAGALAQRSDLDVTPLRIVADNPGPGGDTYGIASIDGCDRSVATTYPAPGGSGTYVPIVQCFIDMNSDRTITVSYKDVAQRG
jgi:hypothetical protein